MMSTPTILITGANRGIGFAFVKAFLEKKWNVIATVRNIEKAEALVALGGVRVIELDCNDEQSINTLIDRVGHNQPIHVLVNNAGVIQAGTLHAHTMEHFLHHFKANTFSPVLITKVLHPLLKLAAQSQQGEPAKVINISSYLGSNNEAKNFLQGIFGVVYSYSASKAAANMYTQCLAHELKPENIAVASLHPGYVITDLTDNKGEITPAQSVAGMVKVIDSLSLQNTGAFIAHSGEVLPW